MLNRNTFNVYNKLEQLSNLKFIVEIGVRYWKGGTVTNAKQIQLRTRRSLEL